MGNLRATAAGSGRRPKASSTKPAMWRRRFRLRHRIGILVFGCAAMAPAQDAVTVPLSSPSQPAKIMAHTINGNITVTPGSGGKVVVESQSQSRERSATATPRRQACTGLTGAAAA